MEWYDPDGVTTKDGNLVITISEKETHGLHYQGGKVSCRSLLVFSTDLARHGLHMVGLPTLGELCD